MKFLIVLAFLFLTSCAPPEVENNDLYVERIPPDQSQYFSGDFSAKEGIDVSMDLKTRLSQTGNSYSISQSVAGLSFNTTTGILSGTPTYNNSDIESNVYEITVSARNALNAVITTSQVTIVVNGDPLRQVTWHLNNTGQDGFSGQTSISGVDIKAFDAWKLGYTGKGVSVAVSDSGVDIDHNDLYENASLGTHKNYALSSPFTTDYPIPTSPHGTAVSGLIAGKGWNNEGGTGVAPDATLSGFQFLSGSNFSTSEMIDQANGSYRIYNYSYGDYLNYPASSDSTYLNHIKSRSLGTPSRFYVKAAGNEYEEIDSDNSFCGSHNANFPMENESPYMIVVSAVNAAGRKSSYSSAGSNVWVAGLGGEYGDDSAALLTTDLPTCFKGYSQTSPISNNPFEYGHPLNEKCNYTASMNGTSGATPIVSGVLALMLEANPNISNRDAKHILALTSTQVDANTSSYDLRHISNKYSACASITRPVSFDIDGSAWTYAQGWVKNKGIYTHVGSSSAGLNFHNFYGFGLVNAYEAVKLAKALKEGSSEATDAGLPLSAQETHSQSSGSINLAIPSKLTDDMNIDPYVDTTLNVSTSSNFVVESIQVVLNLSHTWSIGELAIEVISPQGTRSILADANNTLMFKSNKTGVLTLTSHAFYGELASGTSNGSAGTWKLRVVDGAIGDTGTLNNWTINVLGHQE